MASSISPERKLEPQRCGELKADESNMSSSPTPLLSTSLSRTRGCRRRSSSLPDPDLLPSPPPLLRSAPRPLTPPSPSTTPPIPQLPHNPPGPPTYHHPARYHTIWRQDRVVENLNVRVHDREIANDAVRANADVWSDAGGADVGVGSDMGMFMDAKGVVSQCLL